MADPRRGKEGKLVGLSATLALALALALSRKSLAPMLQLSNPLMRRTLGAATHQRMLARSGSLHLPRIGHFSTSTLKDDRRKAAEAQAYENQQTCECLRGILKEEWESDLEARRKIAQLQASQNWQICKHFGGPYDVYPPDFYLNGDRIDYEALFHRPTKPQEESKNQGAAATKLR